MTKSETITIMEMLIAFYGKGEGNPEKMADGWHSLLGSYEFDTVGKAVLKFVKNDEREYALFPTANRILKSIENEIAEEEAPAKEIERAVAFGWGYESLSKEAKERITEKGFKNRKMKVEETK